MPSEFTDDSSVVVTLRMQVPAMDWLLHEGYSIFWSVSHDEKMMNVANHPKRKSPNLQPIRIVSFIATAYSVVRKVQRIRPGATNSGGRTTVEAKDNTVSRTADRLGFWSAYFSAIFAVMYVLGEIAHLSSGERCSADDRTV